VADWDALKATMLNFCRACNDNQRLRQMNHDWNRTVEIRPNDHPDQSLHVRYRAGEASLVDPSGPPDLVVEAPTDTLQAIFSGAMTPTEPYMDGTLRVQGSQDDMMRLDIISLLIWGE